MSSDATSASRHHDTIIIGAGMSGMACAQRLSEHTIYQHRDKLLILEARDRTGGRIGSVHINGSRLDTGANWIHGVGSKDNPNPLVEILPHKKYKELGPSVTFRPSSHDETASRDATGPRADQDWVKVDTKDDQTKPPQHTNDLVVPPEISSKLLGSLWELIGSLHDQASETSPTDAKATTILRAIADNDDFRKSFEAIPEKYHQVLRAMPQFVESMEAGPLALQSAEHESDHPGMGLLEYALDDFDGEQVFLRDGYTAVLEEVGKDLVERDQVQLGVEVQQIAWEGNSIKLVTCAGEFTARRVVCTLPLGVLQHHIKLSPKAKPAPFFHPPLPEEKSDAVLSLGFGTLDKIFLVYSEPWWTQEPYATIIEKGLVDRPFEEDAKDHVPNTERSQEPDSLWGFTDELAGIEIDQHGESHSGTRALSVMNLHALTGFPVLSSFVSCANAIHVEGISDHEAGMIVHRALSRWLGCEPPKAEAVHVTRWASDEYSRGSYSHMITNLSETRHREAFQKPIVNSQGAELRFAGEHTSLNHL